jgi:HPt (histidine-containing phosphotransfer) domain-containing protein
MRKKATAKIIESKENNDQRYYSDFDPKIIDLLQLQKFNSVDENDSNSVLHDMIELFLRLFPEHLNKMKLAVKTRNSITIAKEIHSLKSNCGYMGAIKLLETCLYLETFKDDELLSKTSEVLDTFETNFNEVKQELEKLDQYILTNPNISLKIESP